MVRLPRSPSIPRVRCSDCCRGTRPRRTGRASRPRATRVLEITDQGSEHLWLAALDPEDGRREAVDHPNWDVELAVSSADGRVQMWSVNEDGYSRLRWRQGDGQVRERELRGVCEDLVVSADG